MVYFYETNVKLIYMKKNIIFLILSLFISLISARADSWDDFSNVDRMWDGQKSITNKEFENVINSLEEKGKQKEEKKLKKKRKKLFGTGTTLHSELNPDNNIPELESVKSDDNGILVNISVHLIIDGKQLEKGYYNVFAEKDDENKKLYVSLYQSQYFKGKIEVTATEDDFGEEDLNFAKIIPFNESFVKIIFGSIDYNAYAYVPYTE